MIAFTVPGKAYALLILRHVRMRMLRLFSWLAETGCELDVAVLFLL